MAKTGIGPGTANTPGTVRIRDGSTTNLAAVSATGALLTQAGGDTAANADGLTPVATATLAQQIAELWGFNGATFDRLSTVSAVGDGLGTLEVMQPSATYGAATATNATATVTFAAVAGQQHRLTSAQASYSGTLTAATNATVTDNAAVIYQWLGTVAPYGVPLPPGGIKQAAVNTAMTVTIGGGGAAAVGNVLASKLTA